MVTAALAKASGAEPTIVGKPSEAALEAIRDRLGLPTEEIAVIGDDLTMDVALGRLGGRADDTRQHRDVAAASSGSSIAEEQRPDEVVERRGQLLDWLKADKT